MEHKTLLEKLESLSISDLQQLRDDLKNNQNEYVAEMLGLTEEDIIAQKARKEKMYLINNIICDLI